MENKDDKTTIPSFAQVAALPIVQGPVLGATVMWIVTPGLNITNSVMDSRPIIWRQVMSGAFVYASSAVPSFAIVFGAKKLLDTVSEDNEILKSFASGAISGAIGTPFDAITQNKALAKIPSAKVTCTMMITHNGYSALFQGATITMLRESIWAMVYLSAVPTVSLYFQAQGMNKNKADAVSLVATAGSYGFFSTPLHQLRFRKQQGLTETRVNKSYWQHAKDIWNKNAAASTWQRMGTLFRGATPRTATVTVAGGLLVKGKELYDDLIKSSKI